MPYRIKQDLDVAGTGTFSGNVSVPDGTTSGHAINKGQFDAVINDIRNKDDSKPSVRATITGIEVLTGTYTTASGVVLIADDRVLRYGASGIENGTYIVAAGAWARADDGTISNQSNWRVEEGSDAGIAYVVTTSGAIILGTTPFIIVPIAAAASLVADSNGSTEIVSDEIRVRLAQPGGVSAIEMLVDPGEGVYVDQTSVENYLFSYFNQNRTVTVVADSNVSKTTAPSTIDGITLSYPLLLDSGSYSALSSLVLLNGQTDPINNGLHVCYSDGVNNRLQQFHYGICYINFGTYANEVWFATGTASNRCKRIYSPTYFQTLVAGVAATHTITHNKRTTRPQVKLFDTVTNEEIYAQPSNISLNSFDLVLSVLANAVQVVVNITPDA